MNTKSLNKFNNLKLAVVAAFAVTGVALSTTALAATDTATTGAVVVTPIAITDAGNLNFGSFAAGPTAAGTVVVTTAAVRSKTDGVMLAATGAPVTAAKFNVTGHNNMTYTISITDDNLTDGAATMALATTHELSYDTATGTSNNAATGTLSGTGAQSIFVGGTLTVAAAQAAGTYAGTITAVVEYN